MDDNSDAQDMETEEVAVSSDVQPQPPLANTCTSSVAATPKPKLDADEMRRRRLAKITSSTVSKNNGDTQSQSPSMDIGSPNLSRSSIKSTTNSTSKVTSKFDSTKTTKIVTNGAPKTNSKVKSETLFTFAKNLCGNAVRLENLDATQEFVDHFEETVAAAIFDTCNEFFSSDTKMNSKPRKFFGINCDSKVLNCLQFLFELYQNSNQSRTQLSSTNVSVSDERRTLCDHVEMTAVRYVILLLTNFFHVNSKSNDCCSNEAAISEITCNVLCCGIVDRIISFDFLAKLCSVTVKEFSEETLHEIVSPMIQSFSYVLTLNLSLQDKACVPILDRLVELVTVEIEADSSHTTNSSSKKPIRRPFLDIMCSQHNWIPVPISPAEGREMQKLSLLGPFLSLSCLNEDDPRYATHTVPDGLTDFRDLLTFQKIQQTTINLRRRQFSIVHQSIVNQQTRSATIDLLATYLTTNMKRAQLSPEATSLATHGFMLNLLSVITILEKKVPLNKVNAMYLTHPKCRFDLSSESLMKMSAKEFTAFCDTLKNDNKNSRIVTVQPNFNTECFFFTLYATHLCFIPAVKDFGQVIRTYKQLKNVLQDAERQHRNTNPPNSFVESRLREMKEQLDSFYRSVITLGAVLAEEDLLADLFQFYGKVMDLLLAMVSGGQEGGDHTSDSLHLQCERGKSPELPLRPEPPNCFKSFPSFIIEDISDFISLMVRHSPGTITCDAVSSASLVNFLVTFSCSSNYISNPYLVAKMIEIIYYLNPTVQNLTTNLFNDILSHKEAIKHFAPCLIQFYVAIESTGSSNEFYDKFSIRYHLTIIFMSMWSHVFHKASMIQALNSGGPFVRFVNLLINDTTFLLDESLECIKRIHNTQKLMKNTEEWNKLSRDQQAAKKKKLSEDEGQCKSYMTLVNETLNMFHYLTKDAQKPFLLPEIIGRLAAMLNSYLSQLVGPNYKKLNIENRDKYGFYPKKLLNIITDLYLHLDSEQLVNAIAVDDRSYREEMFVNAAETLRRVSLKTGEEMERFMRIAADAKQCYVNNMKMDEDFEDAPDHYRDPITQMLMSDPVRLPSGNIMDRSVVTRILLDNAIDPFSRAPLTQQSVKECPELKQEIEEWKKARSNKH